MKTQRSEFEDILNPLLDIFEAILPEGDEIFEIVIDTSHWKLYKENSPAHPTWAWGDKIIPVGHVNFTYPHGIPALLLKSKKGVILKWPCHPRKEPK